MPYDLQSFRAPRLTGTALRTMASAVTSPATRWALMPKLLRDAGVERFRAAVLDEPPSVRPPLPGVGELVDEPPAAADLALPTEPVAAPGAAVEDARAFAAAYRDGVTTPSAVADRWLAARETLDAGERPLRAMIRWDADDLRAQAAASDARHARGEPLGPLDGVPVVVKDELDQRPYPTTVGTAFLGTSPASADATVVERLRAQGALLVGKANMHEIGIGVTGINPHHGSPRNPHRAGHCTGGSSSGSAAAIAAGLAPIAVGADGGGSIRTPAALCGVVGLKATHTRISEHGVFPLCWSVGHVGPLGATVDDVAAAYRVMAGPDPHDPWTHTQPAPHLRGLGDADLGGRTIGVYRPWFEHADADVVAACDRAVETLRDAGAEVREIDLPDLELARVAQLISISSEMRTSMTPYLAEHGHQLGADVRMNLALAGELTAVDYVLAQRVRTRLVRILDERFAAVDAIATPTTACTAPPLRDAALGGESDLETLSQLMRFVFLANLTGHPALSQPAGFDGGGLPVGLQLIGRPWQEHLLLRLARVVEAAVERRAPELTAALLDG